ncbi:MAG: hypothetical protein JHC88_20410 [Niveispirillum sp.]|nr:hypothetical protein [Niveispirillum sp.]
MQHPGRRDRQRGFALLAALFVLVIGTALVARMTGDGLAARRMAATADPFIDAARADIALDALAADLIRPGNGPVPRQGSRRVDGVDIGVEWRLESGRIDLNFLAEKPMAEALVAVGLDPADARSAARAIAAWRGDGAGVHDSQMAFWSPEDIDRVPDLSPAARRALRRWGSVAARGPFAGVAALDAESLDGAVTGSGLVAGVMLRLSAASPAGRCRSRVVMAAARDGRLVFRRVLEDGQCPG